MIETNNFADDRGKLSNKKRINQLENRLNALLNGKIDLNVVELSDLAVSPKSKLRVACE